MRFVCLFLRGNADADLQADVVEAADVRLPRDVALPLRGRVQRVTGRVCGARGAQCAESCPSVLAEESSRVPVSPRSGCGG